LGGQAGGRTGWRAAAHPCSGAGRFRRRRIVCVVPAAVALLAAVASWPAAPAGASSATVAVNAGSLAFATTPPNVSFTATLTGLDKTVTATQALDVSDATGSGAGWSLTATSTTLTTGGGTTLATTAVTVTSAPSSACDVGATCVVATNGVSYPYALPAAATAPAATKLFDAAANTGMGNLTATVTWSLTLPASTKVGTYTSTWTISLASGP